MQQINIRRLYYRIRHKYLTLNNVVIVVAFAIAASWVWGSLGVMQRNYSLQREIEVKKRQLQLADLETSNLELNSRYYQTREYLELAARQPGIGLALPGEKVLVLPPNSQAVKDADQVAQTQEVPTVVPASNFRQWVNFLFGGNSKSVSG